MGIVLIKNKNGQRYTVALVNDKLKIFKEKA